MDEIEHNRQSADALREQAWTYRRQMVNWLSLSGAGGVVALLSFCANLPHPDHALSVLLPSLGAFVLCVLSSGFSLLALARDASAREHYHRRMEFRLEALADQQGAGTAALIQSRAWRDTRRSFGDKAELSFRVHKFWQRISLISIGVAGLSFACAAIYPIVIVAQGSRLDVETPAPASDQSAAPTCPPPKPSPPAKAAAPVARALHDRDGYSA